MILYFPEKDPQQQLTTKEKLRLKKKAAKKIQAAKRARLIIKNLPFTADEENVREHFEKFGEVTEINLLKKPDGKLVGCGFVQFTLVQKAAKAKHHLNGKDFLGRNIEVNFVLSKDIYKKKVNKKPVEETVEIKDEPIDLDLSIVKDEVENEDANDLNKPVTIMGEIKEEDDENITSEVNEICDTDAEETDDDNTEDSDESEDDSDDTDNEEKNDVKDEIKEDDSSSEESEANAEDADSIKQEHSRVMSNDIKEGKTVFVKNIPFTATNEDFKECMRQFGTVYYALICMDKLTEHSKGTGFVKFVVSIIKATK